MRKTVIGAMAAVLALAALLPGQEVRVIEHYQVCRGGDYILAVPKEWKKIKVFRHVAVFQGEGRGIAEIDETDSAIRSSLVLDSTVGERKTPTLDEACQRDLKALQGDARVKVLNEGKAEKVALADGAEGLYVETLYVQDGNRRTLSQRLYAKGYCLHVDTSCGKDSKFLDANPELFRRLKAYIMSLCFDFSKFKPDVQPLAGSAQTATAPAAKSA